MKWRRWNFILHRDIGYLCIGLTLIYGISGIAVNHLSHSFNPSYSIEKTEAITTPLAAGKQPDMEYIGSVLSALGETAKFTNAALTAPGQLRIFVEGSTIDVALQTGRVAIERVDRRPLLYQVNFLHLNKGKGAWTWLADIYGLALILLAISGMLMIRGRRAIRAITLTLAGFLLPLGYLFFIL